MLHQTFLTLKKKKKPLATSAFSIQHLTVMSILVQGWKVENQFDTKAKDWGPKQYLNHN